MELEYLASSNPPSSDDDGSGDSAASVEDGQVPSLAMIQEDMEARICVPLQTPVLHSKPRLRRSTTPASIHSLRRSGRLAAQPRAANSTKQAQSVLLKKLGVHVDDATINSDIQKKFKETFRNMSARKQE